MAVLAPPFILCPLADNKQLLGISSDKEDNKIILTIGKNIAIRYHVSDQKQEESWASSRHWLTSKVVYCPDILKYGAAIDDSMVGVWEEHDGHLTNMKKYKFVSSIFELKPTKTLGTLVIFKNGHVLPLSQSQQSNSSSDIRVDEILEKIISVEVEEKSNLVFIVCGSTSTNTNLQKTASKCGVVKLKKLKILTLKLETGFANASTLSSPSFTSELVNVVEISYDDDNILGSCVVPDGEQSYVIYLSTDGHLHRRSLLSTISPEEDQQIISEEDSRIANLKSYVSTINPVVIKPLDQSTVVFFGSDASEEGAIVFIYDVTYDLILSRQSLKLYSPPPIMEKVGLNIFVPVGLHILVLNLRITKSLLSSVLGRHQLQSVEFFEHRDPWVKGWGGPEDEDGDDLEEGITDEGIGFEDIVKLVKTLENHGQPQSVICGQVIPQTVENRNFAALNWCLEYFSDIPEPLLINILTLLLSSVEKTEIKENCQTEEDETTQTSATYPSNRQINQILQRPFEQRQMIRSLRSMDFQNVKKFLEYLTVCLETSWVFDLDDADEYNAVISNLMKWISTVFDAHYPQFVFHNETDTIENLLKLMEEKSKFLEEIEGLEPLLVSAISKVSFQPSQSSNSKFRTERVLFE